MYSLPLLQQTAGLIPFVTIVDDNRDPGQVGIVESDQRPSIQLSPAAILLLHRDALAVTNAFSLLESHSIDSQMGRLWCVPLRPTTHPRLVGVGKVKDPDRTNRVEVYSISMSLQSRLIGLEEDVKVQRGVYRSRSYLVRVSDTTRPVTDRRDWS